MIKMPIKNQMKSKGMLAGYGLIALGIYLISEKNLDLGISQIMTGLGIMGIRDAGQA